MIVGWHTMWVAALKTSFYDAYSHHGYHAASVESDAMHGQLSLDSTLNDKHSNQNTR